MLQQLSLWVKILLMRDCGCVSVTVTGLQPVKCVKWRLSDDISEHGVCLSVCACHSVSTGFVTRVCWVCARDFDGWCTYVRSRARECMTEVCLHTDLHSSWCMNTGALEQTLSSCLSTTSVIPNLTVAFQVNYFVATWEANTRAGKRRSWGFSFFSLFSIENQKQRTRAAHSQGAN